MVEGLRQDPLSSVLKDFPPLNLKHNKKNYIIQQSENSSARMDIPELQVYWESGKCLRGETIQYSRCILHITCGAHLRPICRSHMLCEEREYTTEILNNYP